MIHRFIANLKPDIEADCWTIIKGFLTVVAVIAMVAVFMLAVAGR